MKTTELLGLVGSLSFMCVMGGITLCTSSSVAHASPGDDGLGMWEGSGVVTEPKDSPAAPSNGAGGGTFTVSITRTSPSAGVTRSDGKIKMADGKEIVFWQEKTDRGQQGNQTRYTLTSNLGTGGGCCFANGMCQSLESSGNGHAFASTIAVDANNKVRVLITELQNGQAVRFYAQTLAKK